MNASTVGIERAHAAALPSALARVPFGVLRPVDASDVYAHPRPQFARLEDRGLLHRLAAGYYAVVPSSAVGTGFRPSLEAAAFGIAAASFGPEAVVLMGLSAARLHGAIPRALAVASVAVPSQRRALTLSGRPAEVLFVRRDTRRLDAERVRTDLGSALMTTVEQTVLDLAHRPELGGAPEEARTATVTLLARCDDGVLTELAGAQRLRTALGRARSWVQD